MANKNGSIFRFIKLKALDLTNAFLKNLTYFLIRNVILEILY
jgi:hypothetical protein